ncbi:MAG TPA: SoxR reducing system RseC family protein [Pyrinomonadaceae bacterium]|jgi:hypothetical protein|nr:SoxR reducing system RseC family protein [Pyrinomonadaceae bacterium]
MEDSLFNAGESTSGNGSVMNLVSQVDDTLWTPPAPKDAQDPLATALQGLCEQLRANRARVAWLSNRRNYALAFGIPLLALVLGILAGRAGQIFNDLHIALASTLVKVLVLWILAACTLGPLYYFLFHRRYMLANEQLHKIDEAYISKRQSTLAGRKEYLREELFKLSTKASRVFFDDEARFSEASRIIGRVGNALDEAETTAAISNAQGFLNSLSELVSREEREQKEERHWQYAAIFVMIVYLALLLIAATRVNFGSDNPTYLFGVPQSVILWGAAGSLAAILYRFYTEQGRIRFAAEVRWLIARPMIGIIMGGVVYVALSSGLVLLTVAGSPAGSTATAPKIHNEAFWIVAFLAGFSDKFYLGVIDLLVARTVKTEESKDKNTVVTKTERIPEPPSSDPLPSKPASLEPASNKA